MADVKCGVEIKQVATVLLDEIMSKLCSEEISQERFRHVLIPLENALAQQRMKGALNTLEAVKASVATIEKILTAGLDSTTGRD